MLHTSLMYTPSEGKMNQPHRALIIADLPLLQRLSLSLGTGHLLRGPALVSNSEVASRSYPCISRQSVYMRSVPLLLLMQVARVPRDTRHDTILLESVAASQWCDGRVLKPLTALCSNLLKCTVLTAVVTCNAFARRFPRFQALIACASTSTIFLSL